LGISNEPLIGALMKAISPMVVHADPAAKASEVICVFAKASDPIVSTDIGTTTAPAIGAFLNAIPPMVVSWDGLVKLRLSSFVFVKAPRPICTMFKGIRRFPVIGAPEKASSFTEVIVVDNSIGPVPHKPL
jgi:hypothetical protein